MHVYYKVTHLSWLLLNLNKPIFFIQWDSCGNGVVYWFITGQLLLLLQGKGLWGKTGSFSFRFFFHLHNFDRVPQTGHLTNSHQLHNCAGLCCLTVVSYHFFPGLPLQIICSLATFLISGGGLIRVQTDRIWLWCQRSFWCFSALRRIRRTSGSISLKTKVKTNTTGDRGTPLSACKHNSVCWIHQRLDYRRVRVPRLVGRRFLMCFCFYSTLKTEVFFFECKASCEHNEQTELLFVILDSNIHDMLFILLDTLFFLFISAPPFCFSQRMWVLICCRGLVWTACQ